MLFLFSFLSPAVGSNNMTETVVVVSGVRLAALRKCDSHGGLSNVYVSSLLVKFLRIKINESFLILYASCMTSY